MKDSTDDAVDTPLSIYTPRSQRLPSPTDPRLPSVIPRTSSPFSRRRRTISGAVERADNASTLGQTALRHNIPGRAAPSSTPGWEARVSEQDFASSGAGTGQRNRPNSIACASRELAVALCSPHELQPPLEITPSITRRKRPSDVRASDASSERPQTKRPRVKPRLNQSLDGLKFDGPIQQPPSPLFFSNTQRQRPKLPARFSSSEAAARMLSKARHEETHVKTVSLARGTVHTPGHANYPNTSTPSNASRQSLDRSSTTRSDSPDTGSYSGKNSTSSPGQQNLNSIGIIELFEQDERPTLIVDLSESANYGPGPVYPAYVSSSLRSCEGLYEHIVGASEGALQFKLWLSSTSVNKEGHNISLPTCQYANFLWSCSTLRRTLRVVSGTLLSSPGFKISVSSALTQSVSSLSMGTTSAPVSGSEPSDYFGTAMQTQEQFATKHVSNTPIPSIEGTIPTTAVLSALEGNTGIADQQTPTDVLPSPSTYVMDGIPLAPAVPAVTNVNWFSSHIPIAHSISPSFDWTRLPVSDAMPEHIRFARSIDWASTSLGPIGTWGSDLRQMCNLIMASPHPAAMYWGEDLIAIYNEAYIMLAGQKHPYLMGQSYSVAWSEIWEDVKDVFANARLTGEATMKDDDGLFLKRSNYLEETYFSWSIVSSTLIPFRPAILMHEFSCNCLSVATVIGPTLVLVAPS
jgi:hypothetical protein